MIEIKKSVPRDVHPSAVQQERVNGISVMFGGLRLRNPDSRGNGSI